MRQTGCLSLREHRIEDLQVCAVPPTRSSGPNRSRADNITQSKNSVAPPFDPFHPGAYQSRVQAVSALTDATSTDLSAYRAKGGKIIMTHGLADEIVSTDSSTDYYNGLVQRFGQGTVDGFVRFYLMPGVGHGTGPFHPAIDSLSALDQWWRMAWRRER